MPGTDLHINGKATQRENIADNGGLKTAYRVFSGFRQKKIQAYKRYLKKHRAEKRLPGLPQYTNEQLFFIGFAQVWKNIFPSFKVWCERISLEHKTHILLSDPHPPNKYRVNVVSGGFMGRICGGTGS